MRKIQSTIGTLLVLCTTLCCKQPTRTINNQTDTTVYAVVVSEVYTIDPDQKVDINEGSTVYIFDGLVLQEVLQVQGDVNLVEGDHTRFQ